MKYFFALLALCSFTATAHATAPLAAYTLSDFAIGLGSAILPASASIASGTLEINYGSHELRITLNRRSICPPRAMCMMVIPTAIEIILPMTYVGTGFCGGIVINAERDGLIQGDDMVHVDFFDDNGNLCEHGPVAIKPIHVTITERTARSHARVVSTMTAIPIPL